MVGRLCPTALDDPALAPIYRHKLDLDRIDADYGERWLPLAEEGDASGDYTKLLALLEASITAVAGLEEKVALLNEKADGGDARREELIVALAEVLSQRKAVFAAFVGLVKGEIDSADFDVSVPPWTAARERFETLAFPERAEF